MPGGEDRLMTVETATDRAGSTGGGWPRGYLRPCLLLLIAEDPAHGYDLLERLDGLGGPPIDAGTLYRNLRSMEREQLVESHWETSRTGPARRTYRITPSGTDSLAAWADLLTEGRRALEEYLRRCAVVRKRLSS